MERHELLTTLRSLKLHGMVEVFDEVVTQGIRRNVTIQEMLMALCRAEAAERKAKSISYQMKLPSSRCTRIWTPSALPNGHKSLVMPR